MSSIPNQQVESQQNNDVSLRHLIETAGVTLKREDNIWVGNCPFHEDTGQSLLVDPSSQHWQCDGDCQTGGSVVEWVMKARHVSHSHAVELLRHEHPGSLVSTGESINRTTVRQLDAPFDASDDDQIILNQVVSYYHETLKQSPDALTYLQQRGIDKTEAIETFKLGFSNRTLGYRLPQKNRKEGAALRGRLQRLGIIRSSGHEHFRGSLVIPVINNGSVRQIYGRKIADKLRPGTPRHCYLLGPLQGIFNLEAVQLCDELILCQSFIDVLTFWCAGYRNVTASYGLEGFTPELLSQFKQHSVKRVLIAYAANKVADTAAANLATVLNEGNIEAYRIAFPAKQDANRYAVQSRSASEALGSVIRKAVWLGKGQGSQRITTGADNGRLDETMDEPDSLHDGALNLTEVTDEVPEGEHAPESPSIPTSLKSPEAPSPAVIIPAEIPRDEELSEDEPLPATTLPSPPVELDAQVKENEVVLCLGNRRYRIRGMSKNLCYDQLKINLLVNKDEALHVDTFDLYASRPRAAFIKQAALELNVQDETIKKDLGKILLKLEVLQDDTIQQCLTPKVKTVTLDEKEKAEAMHLLQSPDLMQRLLDDYERCGVVGEKTNKLVGYLAALSRKLDNPLAVMIQSTSAAGKSALMEAVLSFMPEEERMHYSAMTGQSLFYMGNIDLKHKILAISEEEGASNAAYALKLLQSEGQLTIASTGKDPDSGRHVTHEYKVEGPVMIFSTTTAIDIDEELLNRCLILTVDEDRAQTQAIHDHQRYEETLAGLLATQNREDILRVHRNAQRLLKPLKVVNPYAEQLTFLDDKTRTRRDHKKYLILIRTIALLHQYQRDIKTTYYNGKPLRYVEVALEDIDIANQLAHEVLGRSLDELPPQTQRLLTLIDKMVMEHCRSTQISRHVFQFTRRDVREYTGWGDTQLKVHLQRLEAMEYLLIHRGGRGQRIVYELLYNSEGKDGAPFLMGLLDVARLKKQGYDEKPSGQTDGPSAPGYPQVGEVSVVGQGAAMPAIANKNSPLTDSSADNGMNSVLGHQQPGASYRSDTCPVARG